METTIIPDGNYVGRLIGLETKESMNGNRYLEWRIVIEQGDEAGTPVVKRSFATTQKALEFMHQELEKIGINAKSAEELDEQKHAVIKKMIRFSVQQNDNGTPNIYIQGLVEDIDGQSRPNRKSLW